MTTWTTRKIKEICEVGRGRVISAQEIESNLGVYPVFSSQSFNKGQMGLIDTYDFDGEYLTWTTDGAYAGTVFYRNGKFNCTNVCGTLKAKNELVSMPFLAYQLSCHAKEHVSYIGNPKLMNNVMAEIQLSMPDDEIEQIKIAEILSTLDQAIEQTEAIIAKQQRIKTGLMQDLLTKGIDENGNIRSEATHEFKDSPLGRIPVEWEMLPLEQLANVNRGKFTHRPRNDPAFYGGEFPFIQTGDVTSRIGRTVTSFTQTLNKKGTQVSKEFPAGTIAITIAANIADTAILGIPMFFPDSVVGAVVREPNNTRFVELMIRRWKPILDGLAPQSAQKNINLETLRPLVIPTPKPEEQALIGKFYESVDSNQERLEESARKLESLKAGLMHDLLTGKVRVTDIQNPILTPESL
jgi:type I restriction enzyme S subunit